MSLKAENDEKIINIFWYNYEGWSVGNALHPFFLADNKDRNMNLQASKLKCIDFVYKISPHSGKETAALIH